MGFPTLQNLRSACAYMQSDQSLCKSLEYSLTVKLLTEQHLEFLSLKGGCTGSSEYICRNATMLEITCQARKFWMLRRAVLVRLTCFG